MARYLFYSCERHEAQISTAALPEGLSVRIWLPARDGVPRGAVFSGANVVWWIWHCLGLFSNSAAGVIMFESDGRIVHRSLVSPGWYRFPNMDRQDLQIGDTWTHPAFRGRGLAKAAIQCIHSRWSGQFDRMWYLVEDNNIASIKVIEKMGYKLTGIGERTSPFGMRMLGRFKIDPKPRN